MATPIGRILLMPQGDFNAATVYNALDWVRNGGAAWVCKVDNTVGIAPPTLPATSNANWQLLSEDGTVGGWSSIANKPFETIGAGLDVNLLNELEVAAENTYIPTGTSSDRPISGQGVADALTVLNDYYDKTDIDNKLSVVVKYAGKKTFSQLTSALLTSTYENNFFMLSDDGYITSANIDLWNDNFIVGDHVTADSHIAVIAYTGSDPNKGAYVFDDFGGFVEVDEFTSSVTQANDKVVFDDLNPDYGYKICFDDQGATGDLSIPKWTNVKKETATNSTSSNPLIKLTYTISGGTNGTSKFALRILK